MNWLRVSQIASNFAQTAAVLAAAAAALKWLIQRRDRSTDVLLQLEDRFSSPSIIEGRKLIEHDEHYSKIRRLLLQNALASEDPYSSQIADASTLVLLESLDSLLRFYVLLYGIREAGQVSDTALRACYRYWLAHYFNRDRREFKLYVHQLFPTLRQWLEEDSHWARRSFFRPEHFGWARRSRVTDAEVVAAARNGRVFVVTGAGLSADSGLKTFRGPEGLWRRMSARELATRKAFDSNASLVWEFYRDRRSQVRSALPNAGHKMLVELTSQARECFVVTQNVDDLHERSGLPGSHLAHVHGEILQDRCIQCGQTQLPEGLDPTRHGCARCGGRLRPGVVWFDEDLDAREINRVESFLSFGPCDLVLVVGTSASFDYIVDWIIRAAGGEGLIIEFNPDASNLSPIVDRRVDGPAAVSLPRLFASLAE